MSDSGTSAMINAVVNAYDEGWRDALTEIAHMLRAKNLSKEQVLEIVEELRDDPPPKEAPDDPS